jgi:hypothetical protein
MSLVRNLNFDPALDGSSLRVEYDDEHGHHFLVLLSGETLTIGYENGSSIVMEFTAATDALKKKQEGDENPNDASYFHRFNPLADELRARAERELRKRKGDADWPDYIEEADK